MVLLFKRSVKDFVTGLRVCHVYKLYCVVEKSEKLSVVSCSLMRGKKLGITHGNVSRTS